MDGLERGRTRIEALMTRRKYCKSRKRSEGNGCDWRVVEYIEIKGEAGKM